MRLRENPIFGRKVFFINPPFVIEKKIAEWLKEQEYEVYLIKNYRNAKSVLRYFENAMCFIYIDDDLTLKGWFNYIKSFSEDPQLSSIFIGIMSLKTPEATIQKFIMNLSLPGGYVPLNLDPMEVAKRLSGILEINGAKGNRKYLSLTCNNVEALTGHIAYGSKFYSMSFENISTIGITCSLPKDLSQILKKNMILPNVALSLGRWSVITQCVVLSINTFEDKVIAILLFTLDTPGEVKVSIRKFIYEVLNKHLWEIIKNSVEDNFNYGISSGGPMDSGVPDYNAPTDGDTADVENAEEIVEAEEVEAEEVEAEAEEVTDDPKAETPEEEQKESADDKDKSENE